MTKFTFNCKPVRIASWILHKWTLLLIVTLTILWRFLPTFAEVTSYMSDDKYIHATSAVVFLSTYAVAFLTLVGVLIVFYRKYPSRLVLRFNCDENILYAEQHNNETSTWRSHCYVT